MSLEKFKKNLILTSTAEKWANHVLTCQKQSLMKEKSEDAFRDLLFLQESFITSTKTIQN
jgi:hypothetical protein